MTPSDSQREVLEDIADMQDKALMDFMARMDGRHESLPPTYQPSYADHTTRCGLCGDTEMLSDDIRCTCHE